MVHPSVYIYFINWNVIRNCMACFKLFGQENLVALLFIFGEVPSLILRFLTRVYMYLFFYVNLWVICPLKRQHMIGEGGE